MKRPKHLDFIRELPCLLCPDTTTVEAAHIRYGDPRADKPITGIGIKPDDAFAIPLCGRHHREQHTRGERKFWEKHVIDPVFVALALFRVSGDHEAGCRIVEANRS